MADSLGQISSLTTIISVGVSAAAALTVSIVTSVLARRRDHESEWRKLKFSQYQQFYMALSGIVRERANAEAHGRYADAVNSLYLVAPIEVLNRLAAFQKEISLINSDRSDERHDKLLAELTKAMRRDINLSLVRGASPFPFRLQSIPPD